MIRELHHHADSIACNAKIGSIINAEMHDNALMDIDVGAGVVR